MLSNGMFGKKIFTAFYVKQFKLYRSMTIWLPYDFCFEFLSTKRPVIVTHPIVIAAELSFSLRPPVIYTTSRREH